MTLALQELGAEAAGNIQPLLVTVDPERDTVEKMALYLGGYPGITGLRGSEQQIKDAMKAYKV